MIKCERHVSLDPTGWEHLFIYLAGLANFTDKMSNTEKERHTQDTTLKQ